MNVYDFDETIYDGDSTRDFSLFLIRKQPALLRYLPRQLIAFIQYSSGHLTKTQFKESYYSMFKSVRNMDDRLNAFWNQHEKNIKPFYFELQQPDDLIISASPTFLLEPMMKRLGITHLIASEVDATCGLYSGENCYGGEKVHRFLASGYDPEAVEAFYSDSCSDFPLAELATEAYIVQGNRIGPWEKPVKTGMSAFFHLFNERNFLINLLTGTGQMLAATVMALILSVWLPFLGAYLLGFIISLAGALLLGKRMKEDLHVPLDRRIFKQAKPYLPNVILQSLLLGVLHRYTRMPKGLIIALVTLLGFPITYLRCRLQVHRLQKKERSK